MTQANQSGGAAQPKGSQPNDRRPRPPRVGRSLVIVGSVLLAGIAGGTWWGLHFVYNRLSPLVSKELGKSLNRPVIVGPVEGFWINRIKVGASTLAATEGDPDRAQIQAIDVRFNPLDALFKRSISLDLTLVQPDLYIEQDANGVWVPADLFQRPDEERPPFEVLVKRVQVQNAKIALSPAPRPQQSRQVITFVPVNGSGDVQNFRQPDERIVLDVNLQSETGGRVVFQGEIQPEPLAIVGQARLSDLSLAEVSQLAQRVPQFQVSTPETQSGREFLPISIRAGQVSGNLAVTYQPDPEQSRSLSQLPNLNGVLSFQDLRAEVERVPGQISQGQGRLRFQGQKVLLEGVAARYGRVPIELQGGIDLAKGYDLSGKIPQVTLTELIEQFQVKPPLAVLGALGVDFAIQGPLGQPRITGALATTRPTQIDKLIMSRMRTRFELDPKFLTLRQLEITPADGGQVIGDGRIGLTPKGELMFNLQATDLPGDTIARRYGAPETLTLGRISAVGRATGTLENPEVTLRWQAIEAQYPASGELRLAGKQVLLRDTVVGFGGGSLRANGQLVDRQWQVQTVIQGVQLGQVSPGQRGLLGGTVDLSGSLDDLTPRGILARGNLQLPQGVAQLNQPITAVFNWDGNRVQVENLAIDRLTAQGIISARFNAQNRPELTGIDLNLQARDYALGSLPLSPDARRAIAALPTGRANFVGRLSGLPANLRLEVRSAQVDNLRASGLVLAQLDPKFVPTSIRVNLAAQVRDYDLSQVPLPAIGLPQANSTLAGRLNFTGQVQGGLDSLQVRGNLVLNDLMAGNLDFAPRLAGELNYALGRGGNLDLTGGDDRIQVALGADNLPSSFLVKRGETIAEGRTANGQLITSLQNFPIAALGLTPDPKLGTARGNLSGNFNLDLRRTVAVGSLKIENPALGRFSGDRFTANLRYANGIGFLQDAELRQGESLYVLNGQLNQGADPSFEGNVQVVRGRLQDLLPGLSIFGLADVQSIPVLPNYDRAQALRISSVGDPDSSLLAQLRRLSEIDQLLQQQLAREAERKRSNPLADLREVEGEFAGAISLGGSFKTGLTAEFNITGQNWLLDPYQAQQVTIRGDFKDNVLALQPLRFQTDEAVVQFAGLIQQTPTGQLLVENLPVDPLSQFFGLPVEVIGLLNGRASLAGRLDNPQVRGQFSLVDGALNRRPIESATAGFSINDFRVRFGSQVAVQGPDPINISGDLPLIPYLDPKIQLEVNVRDEGLALLNLVNDQIAWITGQGQLSLKVDGTLDDPRAEGRLELKDAVFDVVALPEPIQAVTGTASFLGDRVVVEGIQANFSKGRVLVAGTLPISQRSSLLSSPANPDSEPTTPANDNNADQRPLTFDLQGLVVDLEQLYRGGVEGNVIVQGSVLSPLVTGNLRLLNGQVLLPDQNTAAAQTVSTVAPPPVTAFQPPEFRDFRLILDRNVLITGPVFNFVAAGELMVQGPVTSPQPQGTIRLLAGQVNLFTSLLTLARGAEQTATFDARNGLDPILNVELVTSAAEVTRSPLRASGNLPSSEVADLPNTSLGALQTIRIRATVQGPASKLQENIRLSSSPDRSQNEIIGLLGGGFLAGLEQGQADLALANLAGSALLTQLQSFLGNALGVSEFRLFPTVISPGDSRDRGRRRTTGSSGSTLGIAAEIGVDISQSFSVSVLKVLNADDPAQFGLRYRVNDEILIRSSTDFAGDSRAVIEYNIRF